MKILKSLALSLLLLLLPIQAKAEFFTDIIVTSPSGIWTDSRAYSSLNAAITAVGANQRTIVIPSQQTVTTLTVPANVTLRFERDGSIANSGQLTINTRNIKAENRQIFTGVGNIDFASGSVLKSGWFQNFESALALTNNDTVTLEVTKPQTLTASFAVGNNVKLRWTAPGNILTANAGVTISNISQPEAGKYQIFAGAGDFDFLVGSKLNLSWFNSLRAAVTFTSDDAVAETIIVDKPDAVDLDVTTTINQSLKIEPGAILSISAGKTLTISDPSEIGLYQVFSGSGTVTGLNAYRPEWWGAKGDDSTDCTAAFASAATAAGSAGTVLLSTGTYQVTAASPNYAVTFYGGVDGISPKASIIKNIGTGHAVKFIGDSDSSGTFYYSRVRNFSVVGNALSGNGISLNPDADTANINRVPAYSVFENVDSYNHGGHGLVHRYSWATRYENCHFRNNGGLGVYLYEGIYSGHNNIIFLNCFSRWNGGTGNNSADYTKGGVRISGAAEGVYWIGGAVESNNAWGFIIGEDAVGTAWQVVIADVYAEGHPESTFTSATGGFMRLSANYAMVRVHDCKISYGAPTGKTGYAFYINDAGQWSSQFKEWDNKTIPSGAGTNIRDYGFNYIDKFGSSHELITKQVNRDFSGANDWSNGDFNTFDSTTGGHLTLLSTATQYCQLPKTAINNGFGFVYGKRYGIKYDASGVTGSIRIASFAQATKLPDLANGTGQSQEFTWLETNANQALIIITTGVAGATLDNLSIVELEGGDVPQKTLSGLLSVTAISFAANGDTALYTVPTGKRCVPQYAVVVANADAGATTTLSIGAAGSTTDFVGAQTLSNLDTQYDAVIIMPVPNATPAKIKSYAAGTVITATVGNQSGAGSNTLYLYGICY